MKSAAPSTRDARQGISGGTDSRFLDGLIDEISSRIVEYIQWFLLVGAIMQFYDACSSL